MECAFDFSSEELVKCRKVRSRNSYRTEAEIASPGPAVTSSSITRWWPTTNFEELKGRSDRRL